MATRSATKKRPAPKRAPKRAPKKRAAAAKSKPKSTLKTRSPAAKAARAKLPARKPRTNRRPPATIGTPKANDEAQALAREVAAAVLDKKALDVVILDVRGRTSYADYIVVASGESDTQLRAMADGVHEKLKVKGVRPISREGEAGASWVLLDYGDVVAHFFDAATRSFYDLEGMWADAPREAVADA